MASLSSSSPLPSRNAQATTLLRELITERPFDSTAYIALIKLTASDNPSEALSITRQLGEREPHKLTAMSSLVGSYALMNSKGSGTSSLQTDQQMFNLNFTTQLGPKTNAGIGARRVVVDGSTNYTENAVTGTLSHQF